MKIPIAWTIAGSDPSGCAGIQADLKTFHSLGVHACSIITAITAQNSHTLDQFTLTSPDLLKAQMSLLTTNLAPNAIKIGMIGSCETINIISNFLGNYAGKIVLDPLLFTSSGHALFSDSEQDYIAQLRQLFSAVDLITPNIQEAQLLLNMPINSYEDMEHAGQQLLALGAKSVLIKGGHFHDQQFSQDYWTNGPESFWLINPRLAHKNYRGTGCTLSSAITASLALGYELKDALVIGKMFVNQAIRLAAEAATSNSLALLKHQAWPENSADLPYLSLHAFTKTPTDFPNCGSTPLGLYPIVDNLADLQMLLSLEITTAQLRIKNQSGSELEKNIQEAVALTQSTNCRLFINDYWELAIKYRAYGVHLGQEDLTDANIEKINHAGLRLGISTHCYFEVARAHAFHPSYMACGPIFPTTSKIMNFAPQGIQRLSRWCKTLKYPLVAIGGINLARIPEVLATGVDGIAMISAITQAENPRVATQKLLALIQEN